MNCSYRILKDVHIGVRVRKTKDKNTVPFKNEPMTNTKLVSWNDQGFELSHPDLPKNIWVDFWQLPLDQINLEMGVIKNPITFVERITGGVGTVAMVLLRCDTLDYMELLQDKSLKDEAKKYAPKELLPGDRVISCLCRESNVMVYLGTFSIATLDTRHNYSNGYGIRNRTNLAYHTFGSTPERAFFAYELPNGKYQINSYALTNKTVVEVYRCDDKGSDRVNQEYVSIENNIELIKNKMYTGAEYWPSYQGDLHEVEKNRFPNVAVSFGYKERPVYVQLGKLNVRKRAKDFLNSVGLTNIDIHRLYETSDEMNLAYNERS